MIKIMIVIVIIIIIIMKVILALIIIGSLHCSRKLVCWEQLRS